MSRKFKRKRKKDLLTIEKFASLIEWCNAGPVDVQIWSDSKRMISASLRLDQPSTELDWAKAGKFVQLLQSIVDSVGFGRIQLSLGDLNNAARALNMFQELVEAPSVVLEFEPSPETSPEFSSLLYFSYIDVCEYTFYALVERPVCEDIAVEGRRRVTCGQPQRIEEYVLKNATEEQRRMMNDDYERYLHRQEKTGTPLGLGDIHVFLQIASAKSETEPE